MIAHVILCNDGAKCVALGDKAKAIAEMGALSAALHESLVKQFTGQSKARLDEYEARHRWNIQSVPVVE